MGFSSQIFLIDRDDRIFRLSVGEFAEALKDPRLHRHLEFAGERVRMVNAVVELNGRKPSRVVRLTYHMLRFDDTGSVDAGLFQRQEAGRFEVWAHSRLAAAEAGVERNAGVIDATGRFTGRGGSWVPSRRLERALHDAALARLKVPRV